MSKKILFFNTSKLAVLSAVLLLSVFCTIGMSFAPAEEGKNIGSPNDSTYVSGPCRSHGCSNSTDYFKGIAIAKNYGTGSGKMYVQRDNVSNVSSITSGWEASQFTTDVLNCGKSSSNDHLYFCAKADDGSYFWGWYVDADCTEQMDDNPDDHAQIIEVKTDQAHTGSSDPEIVTRYAKFSDQPYPYHWYYGKLTANTVPTDGTKGRVYASTETDENNNEYGYYASGSSSVSHTSGLLQAKTLETPSTRMRIYATALPMHGYKFTGWTAGASAAVSEGYDANYWRCAFDVTSDSENSSAPIVGIATANFEDASAVSVTLLKNANRGTVSVTQKYYNLNGTSVKEKSTNLSAFALEEATHTYETDIYPYDRLTLTATPNGDYKFYGWYHEVNNRYEFLGPDATIEIMVDEYPNYFAHFDVIGADNAFMVGFYQFSEWEDALAAAKASAPCTITLLKDYTINTPGYYTIPAGVTLLIPYKDGQTPKKVVERTMNQAYVTPSKFRKLTLASGVHLDVFGEIEAGCKQSAQGQSDAANGAPTGPYGWLELGSGSDITIEDGAALRAWGFVTGEGTIDVRRGGNVYEQFQLLDFKGGTNTKNMCGSLTDIMNGTAHNDGDVFPLNQYFIQNVECKTTYHPGANLYTSTAFYMSMNIIADDIQLVGIRNKKDGKPDDIALFLLDDEDDSEDTWVCKYYNRSEDRQMYDVNNSATIGSFVIKTEDGYKFPTKNFTLPITNNMTIHLLTGEMDMNQNTVLLAGSGIKIDKQATFLIPSGVSLYVYDQAEWGKFVFSGYYAQRVKYVPHLNGAPTARPEGRSTTVKPASASIEVGGTMEVLGGIYTTPTGANIYSSNADAGTIQFIGHDAPTGTSKVCQWNGSYVYENCPSAILRNEDSLHPTTETAGTPAGQSYCYKDGKWLMMTVDPTNECFVYDNYGTYYAKPGAYVALANGKTENGDHTYSDAEGEGRLFILMDECQWWEVVLEDNLYKGIVRDENGVASPNGKFYEYNISTNKWEEKRYTITWKDYDGTVITTYRLTYGTTPQYLSTNPTREDNLDYTYDFNGWSPALETVKGNQIYTATYTETPVRYTITYKNSDGSIINHEFLTRGSNPAPPNVSNGEKILQWNPSIGAVTGNQIYTAEWLDATPETWTITWKNYDGSTLATTTPVNETDAATVAAGAPTGMIKPNTDEYVYTFDHWEPTIVAATSNATYTAIYAETKQTYTVNFYKEGTTNDTKDVEGNLLVSRTGLNMGSAAELPNPLPTKEQTGRTYTLQWKDLATDQIVGVSIPAVSGNTDYVADFSQYTVTRYTITANSEVENETGNVAGCTFTGAGTYDYGTQITLTAIPNTGYEFVKWKDNESSMPTRTFQVTENVTYTAIVRPAALTVDDDETKVVTRSTKVSSLVVKGTPTTSSNLVGAQNVSLTSSSAPVYFDLTRGAGKVFKHHTWYAFSVPFEVDPATILFDGATMQYNQVSKKDDYEIRYYDGSERALNGKTANCWVLPETAGEHLYPGKFYMIANTRRDVTTIRFPKVEGAPLLTTSVNVSAYGSAVTTDANWNGIANPSLYHANMDAIGAAEHIAYVFDPDYADESNAYEKKFLNSYTTIMGVPFFVQAPAAKSLVVEPLPTGPAAAPRRAKANEDDVTIRYQVMIAREGGNATDDVIIRMDEEKEEDAYVLGRDLVRMGMSSINPQIWVARYDEKLCVNVQAPLNNVADYPLGIFAPANSTYEVSIANQPNDETTLYLTIDGEAVWNLSEGAYSLYLDGGTTNHYGLRIVSKKAPEVATGMDEAVVDAHGATQKVLINNQVYIIRGNKVYTVDGQLVK